MSTAARRSVRVAAVQLHISESRDDNLRRAAELIKQAADQGAEYVALPECFTGKYGVKHFASWKETVPLGPDSKGEPCGSRGYGAAVMSHAAKQHGIVVRGAEARTQPP